MTVKTRSSESIAAAERLLDFIAASPTAYQAVKELSNLLDAHGFKEYKLSELKQLKTGDRGYYLKNASAIAAFVVGADPIENGFQIFGAHTDSPSLRIKPNSISIKDGILRLTTEVYGGPILNTYFDRPLSLAGRVVLKSDNYLKPKIQNVDLEEALLILPNLCIHMNREVNDGVKIAREKVLLPFVAMANDLPEDPELWLRKKLAQKLNLDPSSILDYDLYIYECAKPSFVGEEKAFISTGRLDNLAMAWAGIYNLAKAADQIGPGLKIALATDHEEVGSGSKQGAASAFIRDFLESLYLALGASRQEFLASFDRSYMISADLAHALHPNYSEMADPDHRPLINGGPVIKVAASQAYATDAVSAGIFRSLCANAGVPCQVFTNRSDLRGGSTIGPITSTRVPVSTVDIGTAIWGMHSLRETGGTDDVLYMDKLCHYYFTH
ncbi:MAG: M18 family aminopeptidase [Eubacteriales bacterium]|nr:M18 family aminopeptidase [Eubacteriales bacterium]